MAKLDLSRKIQHKPESTKPVARGNTQSWAQTKPAVRRTASAKPKREQQPKGWANGENWNSGSNWAKAHLKHQALVKKVNQHNAEIRRPTRMSATHGKQELCPDGKWRAVKKGRKVGRRKYEGYTLKTHSMVAEIVPEEHTSTIENTGNDGAKAKRRIRGSYSNDGAFRPSR